MKKQVNEVFTPRSASVNKDSYIHRPEYEKSLKRSIEGSLHTIICGESGNGKSWLYKKVLSENNIGYFVVNCGNAKRRNGLILEIEKVVFDKEYRKCVELEESKEISIELLGNGAGLESTRKYEIMGEDPLLECFAEMAKNSGGRRSVLIFDNLEAIFGSSDLMDELANIILLIDDDRFAKFNVKIVIVGVPRDIYEYFCNLENLPSISNRLEEIDEIRGFTERQVRIFVQKTFATQLEFNLHDGQMDEMASHIYNRTLGIAQRFHEYCEKLAFILQDQTESYNKELLELADHKWLKQSLKKSNAIIDKMVNKNLTKVSRRNQVLYVLGKISGLTFERSTIETWIKSEFPETVKGNLNVTQILVKLSTGDSAVIKKVKESNRYAFVDPRVVMCIRILLRKENGKIIKYVFKKQGDS